MAVKSFSVADGSLGTRSLITTRDRLYRDIDLSFQKRTTGDIFKKSDAAAVKQAVKNLLMTNFGEKPFQPKYGGNLNGLLFELADDVTADDIEIAVSNAITVYEPRAKIIKITVDVDTDVNSAGVKVEFQIVNTEEIVLLQTTIARLR